MAAPPLFTVSFLHQGDLPGRFSIRFEIDNSVGAVQVRPSRDTTPTGQSGTLRRVSAAEVTSSFLLYREVEGMQWGELSLWPPDLDPMTLPPGEWVERLPDGTALIPVKPETCEEPLTAIEAPEAPRVLSPEPPAESSAESPAMPVIPVGDHPNALITLLRQRNVRLEEELREVRAELDALRQENKACESP
jgi:hypothetical protein